MPRLRHVVSGVVVSVGDDVAARLGSDWVSAEDPKPAPRRRTTKKDEPVEG